MNSWKTLVATEPGRPLHITHCDAPPLGEEDVEVAVQYCGICHSDLSMLNNDWGITTYPFTPGHEICGTVLAAGPAVRRIKPGDRVGIGWFSDACQTCSSCQTGDLHLCENAGQTIVGRPGGFAERVRCNWRWATPIPASIPSDKAGPLFCAGITVFNPFLQAGVLPTHRVGIVGIGGLGHLALQFAAKWGCEVWAFTSTPQKSEEARRLGAHHTISSREPSQWQTLKRTLDFLLITVNVPLDWPALLETLAPKGRLHIVGAVLEPLPIPAFSLITAQRSVSGTPLGSPHTVATMLEFCSRHQILPQIELFPMSRANDALEHLRSGKPRYRIVLENDLAISS